MLYLKLLTSLRARLACLGVNLAGPVGLTLAALLPVPALMAAGPPVEPADAVPPDGADHLLQPWLSAVGLEVSALEPAPAAVLPEPEDLAEACLAQQDVQDAWEQLRFFAQEAHDGGVDLDAEARPQPTPQTAALARTLMGTEILVLQTASSVMHDEVARLGAAYLEQGGEQLQYRRYRLRACRLLATRLAAARDELFASIKAAAPPAGITPPVAAGPRTAELMPEVADLAGSIVGSEALATEIQQLGELAQQLLAGEDAEGERDPALVDTFVSRRQFIHFSATSELFDRLNAAEEVWLDQGGCPRTGLAYRYEADEALFRCLGRTIVAHFRELARASGLPEARMLGLLELLGS